MIRRCGAEDAETIYHILNDAAEIYRGTIPADCYRDPYMSMDELLSELRQMVFFGWVAEGELVGVMGFQPIRDVVLIRHAYVLRKWQRRGIGSKLLHHLMGLADRDRILVGTWADARWAIRFYEKHGFKLLPNKDELLRKYWNISARQIETSVVLGIELKQS